MPSGRIPQTLKPYYTGSRSWSIRPLPEARTPAGQVEHKEAGPVSRILYRKPGPRQGGRVEHKTKKKSEDYRKPGPRQGGRVEHKPKKKSEVLYDRSRSGRPDLLRQDPLPEAGTPGRVEHKPKKKSEDYRKPGPRQGGRVEHKPKKKSEDYRKPGPRQGGRVEHKWSISQRKKAGSCTIARAPAVRIFYGRLHRPRLPISPWRGGHVP